MLEKSFKGLPEFLCPIRASKPQAEHVQRHLAFVWNSLKVQCLKRCYFDHWSNIFTTIYSFILYLQSFWNFQQVRVFNKSFESKSLVFQKRWRRKEKKSQKTKNRSKFWVSQWNIEHFPLGAYNSTILLARELSLTPIYYTQKNHTQQNLVLIFMAECISTGSSDV